MLAVKRLEKEGKKRKGRKCNTRAQCNRLGGKQCELNDGRGHGVVVVASTGG